MSDPKRLTDELAAAGPGVSARTLAALAAAVVIAADRSSPDGVTVVVPTDRRKVQ